MNQNHTRKKTLVALAIWGMGSTMLQAQEVAAPTVDSGNSAWIFTSTALVLLMTMPGLALFYGGLVRGKNFLSALGQCAGIGFAASLLWVAGVYSLAFKGDGKWIGDLSAAWLHGIGTDAVAANTSIPELLFVMFQMTFAIITPALYIGAVVERMKFSAVLLFSSLWLILVYAPVAKWVWGGGWLFTLGIRDLAGGIVVHATAGVSALVLAILLGKRKGFPQHPHPPHSPAMVFIGAAMLWVGWFGFNAGSQLSAGGSAAMTMLVTHLSACAAALVWMLLERIRNGKIGVVGMVTGLVAGLATITPASGDVGPLGAIAIGSLAALICYGAVNLIREKWHIDDSLDVFAVHGVGGILGTILLAFFGQKFMGGLGIVKPVGEQLLIQLTGLGVTVVWSALATVILFFIVKKTIGVRVSEEQEWEGLDRAEHGENAYSTES
ncbi:MAG: hypothetical protein RI957_2270 [Verrucomicrobiota bacterium]|jgi:Amt family ammonium transporter